MPPPSRRPDDRHEQPRGYDGHTGEVLTAGYVESEIMRLSSSIDTMLDELRGHAQAMADADHAYQVAYAKARHKARQHEGNGPKGRVTNDEAEDAAIRECDDLLRDTLVADVMYEVDKEVLRSLREQIGALRTIAANIRAMS
jgi:hypothetical protein